MTFDNMGDEACILVQANEAPVVHLRRSAVAPVEVLTIEESHALLDKFDNDYTPGVEYWWDPLYELLEGIR